MKRYTFPLTTILLLFAVIAMAAPGDKHPAVTSAAIGLGTSSSPTLASVTATTSVTAPSFNSTAADGYHYVLPYNSIAFAGTALVGMIQTTPTGPKWFSGTEWEGFGGGTWGSITGSLSAQTDLQAALDAISAGGITISTGTPTTAGAAYLNDTTHVLTVASTTGYTQFTGSFTAWDTTPAVFAFTDVTDAALNTVQTATPVQVTDINYPTAVTATGGTAAICTGATVGTCGAFSASPGNVALNQYVSAQHTSSGSNSTAVDTVVTIGGVSDTFTSTTVAGASNYADDFNRTNGALGSSWTSVFSNAPTISNNKAIGVTGNQAGAYWSASGITDNQSTQVDVGIVSTVMAGVRIVGNNGYYFGFIGGNWKIIKMSGGSDSNILQDCGTAVSGTTVKIKAIGSGTVALTAYVDGSQICTYSDSSSPYNSGSPGFYMYSDGTVDNFVGSPE